MGQADGQRLAVETLLSNGDLMGTDTSEWWYLRVGFNLSLKLSLLFLNFSIMTMYYLSNANNNYWERKRGEGRELVIVAIVFMVMVTVAMVT